MSRDRQPATGNLYSTKTTGRSFKDRARYRSTIKASTLKVTESRIIARLLLCGASEQEWRRAILTDNILQFRSKSYAAKMAQLLRARLALMGPELWELVRDDSVLVATHACLAATVKHSPLLGDFLDIVIRDRYRTFQAELSAQDWEHYVEDCHRRDPCMSVWSESTIAGLRKVVFAILEEVGYIDNARFRNLQTVYIAKEVLAYLRKEREAYVLRCIEVQP